MPEEKGKGPADFTEWLKQKQKEEEAKAKVAPAVDGREVETPHQRGPPTPLQPPPRGTCSFPAGNVLIP